MAETSTDVFSDEDLAYIRAHARAYVAPYVTSEDADDYADWYVANYSQDGVWQYLPAHPQAWHLWRDGRDV